MRNLFRFAICAGLVLGSPGLFALGLGNAEVRSYLNEPLETRIELIGATQEELNSVTASLASAADFDYLGITRTVSVPLHFRVIAEPENPVVEVTSRLPVKDPAVQLLLEVRWSGGRMLREYTLFIDPPTFGARAPAPRVSSRAPVSQSAAATREDYPDPDAIDVVETVKEAPAVPVTLDVETKPETPPDEGQAMVDSIPEQVSPEDSASPADETGPEESAVTAVQSTSADSSERTEVSTLDPDAREYGPVERGETLWAIASDYTRGTAYSANQAMLAIQRMNPDAFGGNNINSLKRGEILRLPNRVELGRLTKRQAMVEAIRQETAYHAMRSGQPYDDAPPVLADTALLPGASESEPAAEPAERVQEEQPRLELIPPSLNEQASARSDGTGDRPTGATSSEELEEVLARTEEELANAQQENAYLSERIRELEEQIAHDQGGAGVVDDEMAALESSLREKRQDDATDREIQIPADASPDWLEGKTAWVVAFLALLIGAGVWALRRMASANSVLERGESESESELETVGDMRSEAEDILATLETGKEGEAEQDNVIDLGEKKSSDGRKAKPADDTEVIELDTSDPETQLDLARAYISMGDPEAARDMLETVLEHGNEAQVEEARRMMEEL